MKTYVYFHVCCINDWKRIYAETMHHIRASGLYSLVDEIRCGILGNHEGLIHGEKVAILHASDDLSLYETPTINALHRDAGAEDFNVLYLHTKGVSYADNPPQIQDWVAYLTYFNVYQHGLCRSLIRDHDCDTVGVSLIERVKKRVNSALIVEPCPLHYAGNFWWSTASYLRRLGPLVYSHYNSPEFWLTERRVGNYASLWSVPDFNFYLARYGPHNYAGRKIVPSITFYDYRQSLGG